MASQPLGRETGGAVPATAARPAVLADAQQRPRLRDLCRTGRYADGWDEGGLERVGHSGRLRRITEQNKNYVRLWRTVWPVLVATAFEHRL